MEEQCAVVYLPEFDALAIMISNHADEVEIGLKLESLLEDAKTILMERFVNVDDVYYGTQIEFIGFL